MFSARCTGIFLLALGLGACASQMKQECKMTNWYDHGIKVAKRGERIDSDAFVKACEREEGFINYGDLDKGFKQGMGQYCTGDYAYQVGKRGGLISSELCESHVYKEMQKRHAEGVKEFCEKENGYTLGASGSSYNNVCPRELEGAFKVEYRRGRKTYLNSVIAQKRGDVDSLNRQLRGLEAELTMRQNELQRSSRRLASMEALIPDPQLRQKRTAGLRQDNSRLEGQVSSLQSSIQRTRRAIDSLSIQLRDAETEANGL